MKVLMINGSPRPNGNTSAAFEAMQKEFEKQGIEFESIQIGSMDIHGCIACNYCKKHGRCVFDDIVNQTAPKFEKADALVIGSPVYYASANGTLVSFLDRLFYSTPFDKTMKVGASIAVARRGGTTATFDELNKYFTISGMPIASGQYWNSVHGSAPQEAREDLEGLQNMRTVAKNIAFLIRSIELGKEAFGFPEKEQTVFTNFIR